MTTHCGKCRWATIEFDFQLPERLNFALQAILGSMKGFIAIIVKHFAEKRCMSRLLCM